MAGPAKGGKGAKVASKNNPDTRGAKVKMFFNGKEVFPAKFIGSLKGLGNYMAIVDSDGNFVSDANGNPCKWDLAQPAK